MRLNQFIARATGTSRRQADVYIVSSRVSVNGRVAQLGNQVSDDDDVRLDGKQLELKPFLYVLLNKPPGYVCSRRKQGSTPTIYELLPPGYHHLKPVGRLDKDSSGLLILSDDGDFALHMTHPKFGKQKVYEVTLDKSLTASDKEQIKQGVELDDGPSTLQLDGQGNQWTVTMHEGRNRQIRRTFDALGYEVKRLHRTHFGKATLDMLEDSVYKPISDRLLI